MKATAEQIKQIIADSNVTSTDPAHLVEHLTLEEQGVDSLDRAMVFLNIQEAFGITFEKVDYPKLQSIQSMVAFLNAQPDAEHAGS